MHGETRPVQFDVTVHGATQDPQGQHRVALEVRGTLSRGEFGLRWQQALETGGVVVGDEVRISADISARACTSSTRKPRRREYRRRLLPSGAGRDPGSARRGGGLRSAFAFWAGSCSSFVPNEQLRGTARASLRGMARDLRHGPRAHPGARQARRRSCLARARAPACCVRRSPPRTLLAATSIARSLHPTAAVRRRFRRAALAARAPSTDPSRRRW